LLGERDKTFRDFGYRDLTITEEKLMNLRQQNYSSYLKTGSHDIDFNDKTPQEQLIHYRLMLADSVSQWWEKSKATWTRFSALKTALASTNKRSQELALEYLRFDNTICEGLTLESYKTELEPLVKAIKNSNNTNADQAKYLLEDKEFYWLKVRKNTQ